LTRYMALLLLLIAAGCEQDGEPSDTGHSDYSPVIIIQFKHVRSSSDLPWKISSDRADVSASMLFPDDNSETPRISYLVNEALEKDMLLTLVSDSCLISETGEDNMQIWVDSSGIVRTQPKDIITEIPGTDWLDYPGHQEILLRLFDMYKPDLIFMTFRIRDISSVLQLAEYWTAPEILTRYSVVMFSFSENGNSRGWCVFAGKEINGNIPRGLTENGLFTTIKLLTELGWIDDMPEYIPALSILKNTDNIWRNQ